MSENVKDPVCLCGKRKSEHTRDGNPGLLEFRRAAHQPAAPRRVSHHPHGESKTYPHLMFRIR